MKILIFQLLAIILVSTIVSLIYWLIASFVPMWLVGGLTFIYMIVYNIRNGVWEK